MPGQPYTLRGGLTRGWWYPLDQRYLGVPARRARESGAALRPGCEDPITRPMAQTVHGKIDGRDRRVTVVVARFNELVTDRLLHGALQRPGKAGERCTAFAHCAVIGCS